MPAIEINVRFDPTLAKLGRGFSGLDIRKALRNAVSKRAYSIERFAKKIAPVDTGRLRGSIGTFVDAYEPRAKISAGGLVVKGKLVNYAHFVHEGTRYMRARPFMRWSVALAEQKAGDAEWLKEPLSKEIRKQFQREGIKKWTGTF